MAAPNPPPALRLVPRPCKGRIWHIRLTPWCKKVMDSRRQRIFPPAGARVQDSNHHSAYISALFKGGIAARAQVCRTQTIIPLIYPLFSKEGLLRRTKTAGLKPSFRLYIRPFQRRDRRAGPRLQDSNYYSAYISALFKGGGPLRLRSGGRLAASAAFPIKGTCRRRFLPLAAD